MGSLEGQGDRRGIGYRTFMTDDDRDLPTTDHPLHGEKRSKTGPLLIVLGIFVVAALIYAIGLWVRYNT